MATTIVEVKMFDLNELARIFSAIAYGGFGTFSSFEELQNFEFNIQSLNAKSVEVAEFCNKSAGIYNLTPQHPQKPETMDGSMRTLEAVLADGLNNVELVAENEKSFFAEFEKLFGKAHQVEMTSFIVYPRMQQLFFGPTPMQPGNPTVMAKIFQTYTGHCDWSMVNAQPVAQGTAPEIVEPQPQQENLSEADQIMAKNAPDEVAKANQEEAEMQPQREADQAQAQPGQPQA